jgi:hypothetical protein
LAEAKGRGASLFDRYPPKEKRDQHGDGNDPVLVADLTSALRQMNAEDWRGEHDDWFELLVACKSEGITLADFTEWSLTDPVYADDAEIIGRKWHSVEPGHGGALWRELSRRKIKLTDNHPAHTYSLGGVPLKTPSGPAHQKTLSVSARINRILAEIEQRPTERVLFSYACLVAEICTSEGSRPATWWGCCNRQRQSFGNPLAVMAFNAPSPMHFGTLKRSF